MGSRYIYNKRISNASIRRKLDRRFVSWVLVAAFVGSAVAFGFVYSARCHFEAIELGYQTQERRAALEQEAERRRLLELERERELEPRLLEQRAQKLGLRTPQLAVSAAVTPTLPGQRTVNR